MAAGELQHDAKGASATGRQITTTDANALAVGQSGTTNPAFNVDSSTASSATGVQVKSAAAAGGVAIAAISSGTNENLTIDAKGSGTITVAGTSTGAITLTRAVTASAGLSVTGAISATTTLKSSGATSGIGYATGAGGTVTQITNSSTGVTLNNVCGQVTTVALTTAAAAEERFTVTNSAVAATDCIALGTTYNGAGTPAVSVLNVAAGAFDIVITNLHASAALNAALTVNFAVIKTVTA